MSYDKSACNESVVPGTLGLAISRDAWLAHIAADRELHLHHQDEHRVLASWNGREGFFCHRHGVVVAREADGPAIHKLNAIASSCSHSGSESEDRARRARREISRARAAAVVSLSGLLLLFIGSTWLNTFHPELPSLDAPGLSWWGFLALTMLTTGFAALIAATLLALASVFPRPRRNLLCIGVVLLSDFLALFLV